MTNAFAWQHGVSCSFNENIYDMIHLTDGRDIKHPASQRRVGIAKHAFAPLYVSYSLMCLCLGGWIKKNLLWKPFIVKEIGK